jgi:hypothetical protein
MMAMRSQLAVGFLFLWAGALAAGAAAADPDLIRIDLDGPLTSFPMRVHAHLRDAAGTEYVLVSATAEELAASGRPHCVLATDAAPRDFVLASKRTPVAREVPTNGFEVVHDDGLRWLVRAPGTEAEPLAELGFSLRRLPAEPVVLAEPAGTERPSKLAARALSGTPDPLVADMLSRISTNRLYALMRRLTGVEATVGAGDLAVLASRKTNSGAHIHRATQMAFDHFAGLGMATTFQSWSAGGYSGRNVVATQAGTVRPAEIVVIVAHLDDMPHTTNAPGADDNASGSAAVLTAAGTFRQYRFERTIRFLLVTGEEQGLYGSGAHAAAAKAAGDNLVAVFNMDMIAWDSNADGALDLHTRLTGNPGYAADLAIASAFTNAVARYGFTGLLRPQIDPSGDPDSDHASFWDYGFPAVMAIEDYNDFNDANYHTTGDTLASLAGCWTYYVRFLKACIATVADLAVPVERVAFDAVEIALATATPVPGIGAGLMSARHEAGATESGADARDTAWTALPANTNARSLRVTTSPYGTALGRDARPTNSETVFGLTLSAAAPAGATFAATNRLRFDFPAPPESNRTFLVRVHLDSRHVVGGTNHDAVADVRALVDGGGWLVLPALAGLSNGVAFGTCDVAERFVDRSASNCAFAAVPSVGAQITLETRAQAGTRVVDAVEVSTNLLQPGGWMPAGLFTTEVPVEASTFDSGFGRATRSVSVPALSNAPSRYFRFRRTWPAP